MKIIFTLQTLSIKKKNQKSKTIMDTRITIHYLFKKVLSCSQCCYCCCYLANSIDDSVVGTHYTHKQGAFRTHPLIIIFGRRSNRWTVVAAEIIQETLPFHGNTILEIVNQYLL